MTIWTSDLPDVPVGGTTLHDLVRTCANVHGPRTALVDGRSGAAITYAQLARRIERIAAALIERGHPGDVLALLAPNMPPWAGVALGAMTAGLAVTPVSIACTERELRAQLIETGASVLVTIPRLIDVARAAADKTAVEHIAVIGRTDGVTSVHDWLTANPRDALPYVEPQAPAFLPFSSGTTGPPKAVCLSHETMVTVTRQIQARLRFDTSDVVLAVAPFFHILGATALLTVPLSVGATIICVSRFDPAQTLDLIDTYRVTAILGAPQMMAALVHHPDADSHNLESVTFAGAGGAPLEPALQHDMKRRFSRAVIGQGWGLTELAGACAIPDRATGTPPGAAGRPLPNTSIRVVDPATGADVGPDREGELLVSGPQTMSGYLNREADTAAMFDAQGWVRTGDLGYVDAQGYVRVIDRLKNLIKVNALQVAPAELESLLLTHPAVADVVVFRATGRANGRGAGRARCPPIGRCHGCRLT